MPRYAPPRCHPAKSQPPPGASIASACLNGLVVAAAVLMAGVALYLLKSALGVDLQLGPSFLHDLLYPLLGRG